MVNGSLLILDALSDSSDAAGVRGLVVHARVGNQHYAMVAECTVASRSSRFPATTADPATFYVEGKIIGQSNKYLYVKIIDRGVTLGRGGDSAGVAIRSIPPRGESNCGADTVPASLVVGDFWILAALDRPTCAGKPATIVGTDESDNIIGTSGNDVIVGLAGSDDIVGLGGNDTICGNGGTDDLRGDDGFLAEGDGDEHSVDWVQGDEGRDYIEGGDGSDVLFGGDGDDEIRSRYGQGVSGDVYEDNGNDYVEGGAGNDILLGNNQDWLDGGEARDLLDDGGVLVGGPGDDQLFLGREIYGGPGNDVISGGPGGQIISGGPGNDAIGGSAGGDTISGDNGDDLISGGEGSDIGDGGLGSDTCNTLEIRVSCEQ